MQPTTSGNGVSKQASDYSGKVPDLGSDIKDLGSMTGSLASDAVKIVQRNASEYYDKGVKEIMKMEKNLEGNIQKNPVKSLLIVGGIGLVLGALWNRR